jgi:glutamate synthase domain-containing protein 1
MLVPAVESQPEDGDRQDLRDFYACLTEPWDGPAGLVFTGWSG